MFRRQQTAKPQTKPQANQAGFGEQTEAIISFNQYGNYFTELARSLQTTNPDEVFARHAAFCANCGTQFSREALTHLHLFGPGSSFVGNLSVMGATREGNDIRAGRCPSCGHSKLRIVRS